MGLYLHYGITGEVKSLTEDFGAVGDGSTDDALALYSAIEWAKPRNGFVMVPPPPVKYLLKSPPNPWRAVVSGTRTWGLVAPQVQAGVFLCGWNGYADAVFPFRNADIRCGGAELHNIRVEYDSVLSTRNPLAFDFHGMGNLKMYGCSVGPSNNLQVRATTMFNSDGNDLVCYSGGRTFLYKPTTGVQFSIAQGSLNLTTDVNHFEPGDATKGKTILLYDAAASRAIKLVVSVYNNQKSVTVTIAAPVAFTSVPGTWDHATCDVTGSRLTANVASGVTAFTSLDTGLLVYIQRAGTLNRLHRASITYVSATEVDLSIAAVNDVTVVPFTCPAVAFDGDDNVTEIGITNDFTFANLHIEDNDGVCFVESAQTGLRLDSPKFHAHPSPTDAKSSLACHWIDRSDGPVWGGIWEGRSVGAQGLIHAGALSGMKRLRDVDIVVPYYGRIATERDNDAASLLWMDGVNIRNQVNRATINAAFNNEDSTNPKIYIPGPVAAYGLAPTGFAKSAPGNVFAGDREDDAWTPLLKGTTIAGTITVTTTGARYRRRGAIVTAWARLVVTAIPVSPTGFAVISGLPYTAVNVNNHQPAVLGQWKVTLASGAVLVAEVVVNSTQINFYECGSGITPVQLAAGGILTDTILDFEVTYEISLA